MSTYFLSLLSNYSNYSDNIINIGMPILTDNFYGSNTYTILNLPNYYYTGAYQYNHNTIYSSPGNQASVLNMVLGQINKNSIYVIDLSNDTLDYSIYDTPAVRGLQSFVDPIAPSVCSDFIPILETNIYSFIIYIKNYSNTFILSNSRISIYDISNNEAYAVYNAVYNAVISNNEIPIVNDPIISNNEIPIVNDPITDSL